MSHPDIHRQPAMTRAEIADAVMEGRLSPAEAAQIDPSLAPLAELAGLTPDDLTRRIDLTAYESADGVWPDEPVTRDDMLDEAAWWQRSADDLDVGGDPDRWQEATDLADYWRNRAHEAADQSDAGATAQASSPDLAVILQDGTAQLGVDEDAAGWDW
jgi:hypothetical protein